VLGFVRSAWLALAICVLTQEVGAQGQNVELVGHYDTPGCALGVYVTGGLAYVADRGSLQIIDVTNPTSPTLRSFYLSGGLEGPPGVVRDVYVTGGLAYVAEDFYWNGLEIVDVSNPSAPILRGSCCTVDPSAVYVTGGMAYVADGPKFWNGRWSGDLQIIDVSDPTSPSLRGRYDTPGFAYDVHVTGGLAYVAENYLSWTALQIIDVSNPFAPTLRGSYDTPGEARGVYVTGGLAYVADGTTGGLQIIDVSNPTAPTFRGSYDTPPTFRGSYDTPGYTNGVYVTGGLAYVTYGGNWPSYSWSGLQIIDISNPTSPSLRGSYDTPDFASGVYVTGGLAYVAAGESGLWILRYTVTVPTAPSNLTMAAISWDQVNLSWRDNSNNEQGFKIERKTGPSGSWAQAATVGSNVTAYQDRALLPGLAYFYRVRAYNTAGNSPYSNEVSVTLPPAPQVTLYHRSQRFAQTRQVHSVCADGTAVTLVDVRLAPPINPALVGLELSPFGKPSETGSIGILGRSPGQIMARYTSPEDFCRSGVSADSTARSRTITLKVTYQGSSYDWTLQLYRPPVVMLHGLWGDAGTWQDVIRYLLIYPDALLYAYDYQTYSASGFWANRDICNIAVLHGLWKARDAGYSAGKVDVAAHSMGGVLARLYLRDKGAEPYRSDVHKLITIGTPHSGSQGANYIMGDIDLQWLLDKKGLSPYGGAVHDLCVDGWATDVLLNGGLDKYKVPSHAITSTCNVSDGSVGEVFICTYIATKKYSSLWPLYLSSIPQRVFRESSDLIVARSSQQGGLARYSAFVGASHLKEKESSEIQQRLLYLLNAEARGGWFTLSGFNPPNLSYSPDWGLLAPAPKAGPFAAGTVRITSPTSGSAVAAGTTITARVAVTGAVRTVLLACPSGCDVKTTAPFDFKMGIARSALGVHPLIALGFGSDGTVLSSHTVNLRVTTSAKLLTLETFPSTVLCVLKGKTASVSVVGEYSDGVRRNVTSGQLGTRYTISNPAIARVVGDGIVQGLTATSTTLTVSNGSVAAKVSVVVLERTWYPAAAERTWSLYR
jgi:pimeloyl-ACP methyl ester carboxylesterase